MITVTKLISEYSKAITTHVFNFVLENKLFILHDVGHNVNFWELSIYNIPIYYVDENFRIRLTQ